MAQTLTAWAATAVVLLHLLFIAFATAGAALLVRWPRMVWLHLPAVLWAGYVAVTGTICPLTPLENQLRQWAGNAAYSGGFIEHYLLALIYPTGLTREVQVGLGVFVLLLNAVLYARWLRRRRRY